jgi:hypothetical protein
VRSLETQRIGTRNALASGSVVRRAQPANRGVEVEWRVSIDRTAAGPEIARSEQKACTRVIERSDVQGVPARSADKSRPNMFLNSNPPRTREHDLVPVISEIHRDPT